MCSRLSRHISLIIAETTEFGINPLQSFSTGLADGVKKTLAAKLEADKLVVSAIGILLTNQFF